MKKRNKPYTATIELKTSVPCVICKELTNWHDSICANCDEIPDYIPEEQCKRYQINFRRKYGKYRNK